MRFRNDRRHCHGSICLAAAPFAVGRQSARIDGVHASGDDDCAALFQMTSA